MISRREHTKAWVISVDMGYGHQRAAYALRHLAHRGIINVNNYAGIPPKDRKIWRETRLFYEFISRFKHVPLIGEEIFKWYDHVQSIPAFYPRRDLSAPTFQVNQIMHLIRKSDWGKHLISQLAKNPLPMICTFFVPAFMAEYYNYPGEIYCLATDTDISRAWVGDNPTRSRIKYFAPTHRVADRLKLYGVRPENIFMTGFPLPAENLGNVHLDVLKRDLAFRLTNLDPQHHYIKQYGEIVSYYLGRKTLPRHSTHPLTVTFPVGGAGAQKHLAVTILKSLRTKIKDHAINFVMVAGIHNDVSTFFRSAVYDVGLRSELGKHVHILFADSKEAYFRQFNAALRTTDILWTKPSELSFYAALGIPLIIAPPIGSQEDSNRSWVESVGAGTFQDDPEYTHEWLFDWLDSGWFAEAAMEGFIEAPKRGTFNIERVVGLKVKELKSFDGVLQF